MQLVALMGIRSSSLVNVLIRKQQIGPRYQICLYVAAILTFVFLMGSFLQLVGLMAAMLWILLRCMIEVGLEYDHNIGSVRK